MDPGFSQDLTSRPYGLLIVPESRLTCDDPAVIHQVTGARHDALALAEIAWTATHCQIGITVREHPGLFALAGLAGVLARANQAPSASEHVREPAVHG